MINKDKVSVRYRRPACLAPWGALLLPQGLNQVEVCEFMKLHEGMEDFNIEVISTGDKRRHSSLQSMAVFHWCRWHFDNQPSFCVASVTFSLSIQDWRTDWLIDWPPPPTHTPPQLSSQVSHDIILDIYALRCHWYSQWDDGTTLRSSQWRGQIQPPLVKWPIVSLKAPTLPHPPTESDTRGEDLDTSQTEEPP